MNRLLLGLALVGAFVAGGLVMNSTTTQADDKVEPKFRGTLYPNWKRLGLTEEQTQKIYKIQTNYRGQIDKLEAQIRDLKKKERVEAEQILTPAQKQRLKELSSGENTETPKEKKPEEKKPDAAKP